MVEITLAKLSTDLPFNNNNMQYVSLERHIRILNYKNNEDKKRSLISELLIRKAAYEKLGIPLDSLKTCFNPYGKPYIDNVRHFKFNVSHSGDYVALVTSKHKVGIDIEKIKEFDIAIAERFFTHNEYEYIISFKLENEKNDAFYKLWTLKESYVKAVGKGLKIPLNSFEFMINKDICLKGDKQKDKYRFITEKINGYILSVCFIEKNINCKINYIKEEDVLNYYKEMTIRRGEK